MKRTLKDLSRWRHFTPLLYVIFGLLTATAATVSDATARQRVSVAAVAGDLFCVIDLSGGPDAERWPVSYLNTVPKGGWTDEYKTTKLVMRRIEKGSISGINSGISGAASSITIDKSYYIGVFEVTSAQYALMKGGTGDARPQEKVSYDTLRGTSAGALYPDSTAVDATSIIGILRAKTGLTTLDLPTEVQWEYACRAGTTSDYNNGGSTRADLEMAGRYKDNQDDGRGGYSGGVTTVGSYAPNRWGLYDMHGNVFEWCLEWHTQGHDRALRGGSYLNYAGDCRSGMRNGNPPYNVSNIGVFGFRLCCSSEIAIDDGTGGAGGKDSRFSYSGVYDGQGHGVAVEVTSVSEPHIRYALAQEGPYSDSLLLTNACTETAVWYAVSAAGYNTYTNWATVTIAPRPVTLTSGSASKVYDGTPLTAGTVTVGGDGFVDGEGATYAFTGAQTAVGTSENTFTYSLNDGTEAGNYEIATAYGTLEVTKAVAGDLFCVIDLSGGPDAERWPVSYLNTVPKGGWTDEYKTTKLVMRRIEKGSVSGINGGIINNGISGAASSITVDKPYYIGVFEVTRAQYALMKGGTGDARPQAETSYDTLRGTLAGALYPDSTAVDATSVIGILRAKTGLTTLDLPTEAQWEYACRAGTTSDYNNGGSTEADLATLGRYAGNRNDGRGGYSGGVTTVGSYAPNFWGLYDMHGNVYEWCLEWYSQGRYRVMRGGSYFIDAGYCRSGKHDGGLPSIVSDGGGFRLCSSSEIAIDDGTGGAGGKDSRFSYSGVYDGQGHGISVEVTSVSEPYIRYALAQEGPYSDSLLLTNACTETAMWYAVSAAGYSTYTNWATVTIAPRPVTLTSGSARKVYDGMPLTAGTVTVGGDGFVDGEGATFDVTGSQTAVGTSANTFAYLLNDGTKAGNYEIATAYGTLEVTKATVGPGDDEEPGGGEVPEGGLSAFDATAMYDGEGHTIDTNALVAVFGAAMAGAGETRVLYGRAAAGAAATGQGIDADTGVDAGQGLAAEETAATGAGQVADWREVAPVFTNAGEYAVWYKVTNPNYEDFVHEAKVTITKRAVTVGSRSRTKPYDGTPLRLTAGDIEVSLTDGGTEPALPSGEAFAYGDFAERTAAGETEATFTVSAGAGTQLANYALTFAYGTLTVTKATYPGQEPGGAGIAWSVAADAATWVYDGRPHGVALTGVPAGVTARLSGNAATDAGDYVATAALDYDAANYEPPAAPAPLAWSITPRPVTLMAASKEKPYDGFPLAVRPGDITASGRGYAPGECFDYFDFASLTDVGEIPATFGYRDSATAKVSNYAVTVVGGQTLKVTVGGDQISVTADSGTWAYDGAEHRAETWSVHNGDKLLEGHALQVAIDPSGVVRTPKDGPDGDGVVSNRFASVRVVETATGADRTRNYNLVLCEGVLRVTNACIRAEWLSGTADVAKTYDGAATQAVVTAALLQPATVRYAVGAALPADGWAAEPPSFVHAGTQTVWYAVSADCYEPYTNSLRVAVAPRPVTLATPTKSKTYDGSPLTFGADEVAVGGDGYAPGESFVLSGFASLSDAGRIAARCAYAAGAGTRLADYAVAEDWGTLTVLASADEITVTAADGSWPYDGTAHALHAYAAENADTLRPGDELVVAFAPESVVLTPEDGPNGDGVVSNVIASVRVVRNGSEDVTRNYSLAWYPGTLRVTKARIAFDREGSVDPSAFSTSATYDGAGHAAAVVPPALLTDPVTVRYGASADAVALDASPAFTNAGIHTVFYTLDAPYYETYAGTATVTIAPRPVTLVSAGAEKVYDGTPLRADAVRVKEGSPGFVGDEGFMASCRGALTDVGAMENLFDYALTGGALAGNYAVSKEYGWLRVTPATLDPGAVFGGGETDAEGRLVCARVYNGAPQPFAPAVDFGEPYRLLYAPVAGDEGAYAEAAPTRTHVAEGDLVVFFKFTSPNYAPYYGTGVLRITPKTLTEEMVVADEDAAWFFDGTEKKPSVTVVDGSPNIAAADDWTVAYSDRTGAGLFPVTVTGRNDYCGTVTKEFAILKRPVAPPVIPSRTYSGRLQRPSVPEDARWTVVANPGGTDAGDYTNVVLRLASPADYRWKGLGEDETDWTGVFTVRRGANGWSVYPLIRSWTNGVDAASAPAGRPRFGTLSVAYRRRGTPVATESPERPSAPGRYTARFWAEETANYAGVALAAPYEVDFEIYPGPDDPPAGDATATTPVPVPHAWLDAYVARFGAGDYEAAANAVGANGVALWESYVAGLDPADAASRFTAAITVDADGVAHVTWSPDLSSAESPRAYTVYGKAGLGDAEWTPVTDANRARMRFFRVQVELK